ncbi:hypothetical protein GPROT2_00501 [Gammaproteobacteria bacterium]|jgi:hypothetical protein|nr:hypothetical protein GPROT2_00501 [Gammaproteobacteria bacterium]
MHQLVIADLYGLEEYSRLRNEFRARVMAHKRHRRLHLGPHFTLCFEDRLTMQYQVQEMLRAERIFEAEAISEELATYNPLIPDGSNWKATLLIEYPDPAERARALERLVGVEHRLWLRVEGHPPVTGIADEDLERSTDTKTSSVHFLRFELSAAMVAALKDGAGLAAGVDHPAYTEQVESVPEVVRESLVADLD